MDRSTFPASLPGLPPDYLATTPFVRSCLSSATGAFLPVRFLSPRHFQKPRCRCSDRPTRADGETAARCGHGGVAGAVDAHGYTEEVAAADGHGNGKAVEVAADDASPGDNIRVAAGAAVPSPGVEVVAAPKERNAKPGSTSVFPVDIGLRPRPPPAGRDTGRRKGQALKSIWLIA